MKENEKTEYYLRDVDKYLSLWASNVQNKTIAIVGGARRTGKTTALKHLAFTSFDNSAFIEVQNLPDDIIKKFLKRTTCFDSFKDFLFVNFGISELNINTLIIFDEIQEHNELKEIISLFNKHFDCRFACTGSALWIDDTNGTRPTPDFESFTIYPFSFVQFLEIAHPDFLKVINNEKTTFLTKPSKLFNMCNQELNKLLRIYIAVGGMPQSILYYKEHNTEEDFFYNLHTWKKTCIINTYVSDLKRYTEKFNKPLYEVYTNILVKFGLPMSYDGEVKDAYQKICDMNIVIRVANKSEMSSKTPSATAFENLKTFLLDTGVLFYHLCGGNNNSKTIQTFYKQFINKKDSDNDGLLYENYVACSLIQAGIIPSFKLFEDIEKDENGNQQRKKYELDFVFSNAKGLCVLEAKSGADKTHKSLEKGLKKYGQYIKDSYILGNSYDHFTKNNKSVYTIPFYAVSFLIE